MPATAPTPCLIAASPARADSLMLYGLEVRYVSRGGWYYFGTYAPESAAGAFADVLYLSRYDVAELIKHDAMRGTPEHAFNRIRRYA